MYLISRRCKVFDGKIERLGGIRDFVKRAQTEIRPLPDRSPSRKPIRPRAFVIRYKDRLRFRRIANELDLLVGKAGQHYWAVQKRDCAWLVRQRLRAK